MTNIAQQRQSDLVLHMPFNDGESVFNGREQRVIPADRLRALDGPFSIAVRVHTDDRLWDTIGDIVSWYDPETRTGLHLSIKTNTAGTSSTPNVRNVAFGIDNGSEPAWTSCGRPGNTRMVYALQTHNGSLFAACHESDVDHRGHIYRYEGGERWHDCGAPDEVGGVNSLASAGGHLYAATVFDDLRGSLCTGATNTTPGGSIYRYEGDGCWTDCGNPYARAAVHPVREGVNPTGRIALFNVGGELFAGNMHHPQIFRYGADGHWTEVASPGFALLSAAALGGHLYTAPKALKADFYPGHTPAKGPGRGIIRFDRSFQPEFCGQGAGGQVYAFTKHWGQIIAGTWPRGQTYRSDTGCNDWIDAGACGCAMLEGAVKGEIMAMTVHNGKLYVGTLPLAEVYRYDGDNRWTQVGVLDDTPDAEIRRVWSMAEYDGRLFCGTLPGGAVHALRVGWSVTSDRELAPGWRSVVAVRDDDALRLYIDGKLVRQTPVPRDVSIVPPNDQPLRIGFGANDHFKGKMHDLRIYRRALTDEQAASLHTAEAP